MSPTSNQELLPTAPFPILTTVQQVRAFRALQQSKGNTVGFVPTMGALHEGHLSLVRASLESNDITIISIFVNPAQFAPHEDLSTYPRTLPSDLAILSSISSAKEGRKVSALFLPPVEALYPSGITTNVEEQRGTFLEVKGLDEVMEGKSRPGFFRGVATVVIKLFNIVQPTRAYFGQKDIQQALLLRRMLTDLHVPAPLSHNLIILPTHRENSTHLALSSRNAYLTNDERKWSTVLIDALRASEKVWLEQRARDEGVVRPNDVIRAATDLIAKFSQEAALEGVTVSPLYIALNDPEELFDLDLREEGISKGKGAILSGAVLLGKTRLIDNFVLDWDLNPVV